MFSKKQQKHIFTIYIYKYIIYIYKKKIYKEKKTQIHKCIFFLKEFVKDFCKN